MPGLRTSAIRQAIATDLRTGGWTPSAYPLRDLGKDKGSKVHRSFSTMARSSALAGRQHTEVHRVTTIDVGGLVSVPHDDPQGYALDDAAEDLTTAVLFGEAALEIVALQVNSLTVRPHAAHSRLWVITLTVTARHTLYTHPTPGA